MARRRKPAHLLLIHGRGRFSFDRPPPELFAARWIGRLERALEEQGEDGLSENLSGITFLDYMSLLAPYSRAYRRRLEADLQAVAARMADESREEEVPADAATPPEPLATRYCPDCTGKYTESPFSAPR